MPNKLLQSSSDRYMIIHIGRMVRDIRAIILVLVYTRAISTCRVSTLVRIFRVVKIAWVIIIIKIIWIIVILH
jgi:hypothetical protein